MLQVATKYLQMAAAEYATPSHKCIKHSQIYVQTVHTMVLTQGLLICTHFRPVIKACSDYGKLAGMPNWSTIAVCQNSHKYNMVPIASTNILKCTLGNI